MIYVSPAEQQSVLKAIGESASWVESYGVDYLWILDGQMCGVQRKDVKDLVASVQHDDRLAKELLQMEQLAYRYLVVEGRWDWTRDGVSLRCNGFTRAQYYGLVLSLQVVHGVHVLTTDTIEETADLIPRVKSWMEKNDHGSLLSRSPAPRVGRREQEIWALQGFGFGSKTARAVVAHFGGVPLTPTCSEEELREVPGVGPKRAREFLQRFAYTEEP